MIATLTAAEINAKRAAQDRVSYDSIDGLNQSKARHFLGASIKKAAYALENPKKQTAQMRLGILAHRACLEPKDFAHMVTIPADAPRRPTAIQLNAKKPSEDTVAAIKFWTEFDAANSPESIIDLDDKLTCNCIKAAFDQLLFNYGITPLATEVALVCEYMGATLKGCLDIIGDDGFIYDLKTTSQDATEEDWGKNLRWDKGTQMQMAFYSVLFRENFGFAPAGFRHIVIETEPPFDGRVFEADPELRGYGSEAMVKAIDAWKLYKAGLISGYPTEIVKVGGKSKSVLGEISFG